MTYSVTDLRPLMQRKICVDADSGCWIWLGRRSAEGYGRYGAAGKGVTTYVHRRIYELLVGAVPADLDMDHICRVRPCVNPGHLEPVSHAVNMSRGELAQRTHCPSGHPYAGDNLYNFTTAAGYRQRQCKACNKRAVRAYHQRKRDQISAEMRADYQSKGHLMDGLSDFFNWAFGHFNTHAIMYGCYWRWSC